MEGTFVYANDRPRSLCEGKLLSVTDAKTTPETGVNGCRGATTPSNFRVSWPNSTTPATLASSWNRDLVTYPPPQFLMAQKAPSMAGLLNTTVPQRLVNRPVRGHHTPTRNSLRHSRMICLSQQGKGCRLSLSLCLFFLKHTQVHVYLSVAQEKICNI